MTSARSAEWCPHCETARVWATGLCKRCYYFRSRNKRLPTAKELEASEERRWRKLVPTP